MVWSLSRSRKNRSSKSLRSSIAARPPRTRLGLTLLEARDVPSAVAVGPEFPVSQTPGALSRPRITMAPDGRYVVAWQGTDGDGAGVRARMFAAGGMALTDEIAVNTSTGGDQSAPDVAMDASGNFVVVWQGPDGEGSGVFAQRFDATGAKAGGEFRANLYWPNQQYEPSVAMAPDGRFAIAWTGNNDAWDIFSRRFDADGTALDAYDVLVNTNTYSTQAGARMAANADGYAVAYDSYTPDSGGSPFGFVQAFTWDGARRGGENRLSSFDWHPWSAVVALGMDGAGNMVATFNEYYMDGDSWGYFGQRFDADDGRVGDMFPLHTSTAGDQWGNSIAVAPDGSFVAVWVGPAGAYGQRFAADGTKIDGEFQLNTDASVLHFPQVASDAYGNFSTIWEGTGADAQTAGIHSQQYAVFQAINDAYFMSPNVTLDNSGTGALLDNDGTEAPSPVTVTLARNVAHGSLTLNSDGSFTYTPSAGFVGDDSFAYQFHLGSKSSNVATVTIYVNDQAPTAGDAKYTIQAGTPLDVGAPGLFYFASDPDDEGITAQVVSGPAHGSLTYDAHSGSFHYVPLTGFFGTDSFTYRVTDGALQSNLATVRVTVYDAAPVAANDQFYLPTTGVATSGRSVLANDYDLDSSGLTPQVVDGPQWADSFSLNSDGTFSYVPQEGLPPSFDDEFTYVVFDGTQVSNVATAHLRVSDWPVPVDDSYILDDNGVASDQAGSGVLANDYLPAGYASSRAVLLAGVTPGAGTLSLSGFNPADQSFDGRFTFTAAPGFSGVTSFSYYAPVHGAGSEVFDEGTVTIYAPPANLSAKLVDMTFGAGGQGKMYDMTSDKGEDFAATNKHWLDKNGDGVIDLAQQDHAWPVAYTRNARMRVTATFQLDDQSYAIVKAADRARKLKVKGVQAHQDDDATAYSFDAPVSQIHLNDFARTLTISNVEANRLLPSDVKAINNLEIEWRISVEGGGLWDDTSKWSASGKSENPVYVLLADPKVGQKLYFTVVDLGCQLGWGLTDATLLPDRLMSGTFGTLGNGFANRAIHTVVLDERGLPRGNDEANHQFTSFPLTYYGAWTTRCGDTATLLSGHDGMCGAWAHFFIDILSAQGAITASTSPYISLQPVVQNEWFLVNSWTFAPNGLPTPATVGDFQMDSMSVDDRAGKGTGRGQVSATTRTYPYSNLLVPGDSLKDGMPVSAASPNAYKWGPQPQMTYDNQAKPNGPNNSQNNNNPYAIFNNHSVVKVGDTYYDPSYGNTYASLAVIDDQVISGFVRQRADPRTGQPQLLSRQNPPGRDLYERFSAYGD